MENPYLRFRGHPLSLNDYLAIDRTVLANERTLLSYSRTALTMLVIGGSCLKFLDDLVWFEIVGVIFLVAALGTFILGWRRYLHLRDWISAALEHRAETDAVRPPPADSMPR